MIPELLVWHIDDDPFELDRVKNSLENNSVNCRFVVESFSKVEKFYERLRRRPFADVMLLDIHLGDDQLTGIEVAKECRAKADSTVILMSSSADDVATIAECLTVGADDFISKRSDKGELSLRVANSYRLAKLKQGGSDSLSSGVGKSIKPGERFYAGATAERVANRVPLLINSAVTAIFVRGESGTGKEVVADLFQQALPPSTPFIRVNCGAIAPSLLESELFGHVKGAFTGAITDKRGLLEAASGGWIFLDEVATLSISAQIALLRVLENQEVTRVGSTKPVSLKVRVISATNEPIDELIAQARFRKDLWQRLCETEIYLPPLRERPGEIPALVLHFCKNMAGGPYQASGPVMDVFQRFSWKDGNIRELRNCLRAMTELHVNGLLTPLAIPERIWEALGERAGTGEADANPGEGLHPAHLPLGAETRGISLAFDPGQPLVFDDLSDTLLVEVARKLAGHSGRQSLRGLAKAIGMSRSTLSGRLKMIVQKGMISVSELADLVGVGDKAGMDASDDTP